MNFLKKIFSSDKKEPEDSNSLKTSEELPLDELFVTNFTGKEGKFLYCTNQEEVNQNLKNILEENNWTDVFCMDADLEKLLFIVEANGVNHYIKKNIPFFTNCEQLIAEDGSILFTSKQISETKLKDLPIHFIVFAKTSQILKNRDDALTNIKVKYQKNIPSNISSINDFNPNKKSDDFMQYGVNNSKNLYLLLLEDL